jgi:hypothetical protein
MLGTHQNNTHSAFPFSPSKAESSTARSVGPGARIGTAPAVRGPFILWDTKGKLAMSMTSLDKVLMPARRVAGSCAVSVSIVLAGLWVMNGLIHLDFDPTDIVALLLGVAFTNVVAIAFMDIVAANRRGVANVRPKNTDEITFKADTAL